MGGPSKLIQREVMDQIIKDLNQPITIQKALEPHGESFQSFFETLKQYPEYAESYAHARSNRADIFADQIVELADSDDNPVKVRNQIDARKWTASKLKPSVYSDRLDISIAQTIDIKGALSDAKNRIRDIIQIPLTQLVESTDAIQRSASGLQPEEGETEEAAIKRILDVD